MATLLVLVAAAALISLLTSGPGDDNPGVIPDDRQLDQPLPSADSRESSVRGSVGGPWILHRARDDNSLEAVLVDEGEARPIIDVAMRATRGGPSVLLSEQWLLYTGPQGLALFDLTTGARELLGLPAKLIGHDRGAFLVASIAPGSVWHIDPGNGEGSTVREESVDDGVAAVEFALDDALVARMKPGGDFGGRSVVLRLDDSGLVWEVDSALPEGQILGAHRDLVAVRIGDEVEVYSVIAGDIVRTFPVADVAVACISEDATSVAILDRQGQGRVFDLASGEETTVFETEPVALEFAWLPGGEIAYLSQDGTRVLVVDPGEGEDLGAIELEPPSPGWMIQVPRLTC